MGYFISPLGWEVSFPLCLHSQTGVRPWGGRTGAPGAPFPVGTLQTAPQGRQEESVVFGLIQPPPEGKRALLPPALTFQGELFPNAEAQSSPQPHGKPWGDNPAPEICPGPNLAQCQSVLFTLAWLAWD